MNDIKYCLSKALKLMDVSFTKSNIADFLDKHTDPYSMLALSDFFDSYKIENTAGEFDNKLELSNYPDPHISQLADDDKTYFVIVEEVKNNTVTYYNEGKKTVESLEEYFKKWRGFVLFFKKTPESEEPNYAKNKQVETLKNIKKPIYVSVGLILLATLIYACLPIQFSIAFYSLLTLKTVGIIVSVLLLSYKYDSDNSFVKGICNIGKKGNCGNILNSKAANVFSFLSWSEVGLFYFGSTFLTLIAAEIFNIPSAYYLLVGINILAVPYSFYSVYYQKMVAKTWCVLCLSVQAVLWLEFFAGILLWESFSFQILLFPFVILGLAGISIVAIWYLIKPLLEANTELPSTKRDLKKIKQDISIFNFTLNNQLEIFYPAQADVLRFGSSNPKLHITIFTNPTCIYCSKAHTLIDKLVSNYPNEIAYTSIFAISNDDRDERKQIAVHIFQLIKEKGIQHAHIAMNDWYANEKKEKDTWINKYPVNGNALIENKELIELHSAIANNFKIPGTPVLAINGKLIPQLYKTEDLEFIVPALLNT